MSDNTEIVTGGISEEEFAAQAEANVGFTKDEAVIPFVRILQPLSPQLGNIAGATAGMIINVSTNRLSDGKTGVDIVPITHKWNYSEWVKREEGGGFVFDWDEDEAGWQSKCDEDQKYAYKPVTKDGHIIVKARTFFIFTLLEDGSYEPGMLPFTGTGLKIARQWSTLLANAPKIATSKGMLTPAYFYYIYKMQSEQVKNNQYSWYEPRIRHLIEDGKAVSIMDRPDGAQIWKAAVDFRESVRTGSVRTASQNDSTPLLTSEDRF